MGGNISTGDTGIHPQFHGRKRKSIPSDYERCRALLDGVRQLFKNGNTRQANDVVASVPRFLAAIGNTEEKVPAIIWSAFTLAELGNDSKALEMCSAAIRLLGTVKDQKAKGVIAIRALDGLFYSDLQRAQALLGRVWKEQGQLSTIVKEATAAAKSQGDEYLLRDIVRVLVGAGDVERGYEVALSITNDFAQCQALEIVVAGKVKRGEVEEAVKIAKDRPWAESYQRDAVLKEIVLALLRAGDYGRASQLSKDIRDEYRKNSAFTRYAEECLRNGKLGEALATCKNIASEQYSGRWQKKMKPGVLQSIAKKYAEQGDIAKALDVAQRIGEKEVTIDTFFDVALQAYSRTNSVKPSEIASTIMSAFKQ
jgi:tetratricopeptide (TPR) repeat protein